MKAGGLVPWTLPLALWLAAACGEPAGVTGGDEPPALHTPVPTLAAVVDVPFSRDLSQAARTFSDPAGAGLTYTLAFAGDALGLTGAGATITGVPTAPGVVRAVLTARDARGRIATAPVEVAVFAAGLTAPGLPEQPHHYADAPLPAHFGVMFAGTVVTAADNTPATNPVTDAGATLGRVLFHDRRLSANDAIACGHCHRQQAGFSDTARVSLGFAGGASDRHSMSLVNARFYQRGRFFWDERAPTLEAQVLQPIEDAVEMGLPMEDLLVKLRATAWYAPLFAAAFDAPHITAENVGRALAQFVRSLVSTTAPYDAAFAGATQIDTARLGAAAAEGFRLFTGPGANCVRCHASHAQVTGSTFNNGLDATIIDAGAGDGRFKAPSLRNVAVRGRFMHDGRFATLEEVIHHYDAGVRDSPGLDPGLVAADGSPRRLNLDAAQKAALIAFLKTLTDSTFLSDERFSDPFRR